MEPSCPYSSKTGSFLPYHTQHYALKVIPYRLTTCFLNFHPEFHLVSQSIWPLHYWWALRLFLCFSLIVNVTANSLIHTAFGPSVRVSLRGETAWSLNRYSFLVLIDTVTLPPKFCIRSYSHQQYTTCYPASRDLDRLLPKPLEQLWLNPCFICS